MSMPMSMSMSMCMCRGHLDIFQFKAFYEEIRAKLSELVKHDYNLSILDATSPMRPRSLMHAGLHSLTSSLVGNAVVRSFDF
jgi:hypothetical protein